MKRAIAILLAIIFFFEIGTSRVYAQESHENTGQGEVVEEFDIIAPNSFESIADEDEIQPITNIRYRATVTNRVSEVGGYTGQSVSGEPGMDISLGRMESKTFSINTNLKWSYRGIAQAALGFNLGDSITLSHSSSQRIPYYHNGRRVRSAKIESYVLYDKYTIRVTWTSIYVRKPQFAGKYWVKKPCGYHYKTTYFYQ